MSVVEVTPGAVARPLWLRLRAWVALAGLLIVGALVIVLVAPAPGRALDPRSPAKDGSKALAQVLRGYGVAVGRTTRLADAGRAGPAAAVVVVEPDAYTPAQLAPVVSGAARVVLLAPSRRALGVDPELEVGVDVGGGRRSPGCSLPGARAAGRVDFGGGARTYRGPSGGTSCYGGALYLHDRLAVLGSADVLRNDALPRRGVAALDVNVLTADRTLDRVVWLLPGSDGAGTGGPTVWDLFPAGAHRAFLWALLAGLVGVLWAARRLGPPVAEPLPVVVRAAEVVEGHGRLYRRSGARARAAAALRSGTAARLGRHVGLPRGATPAELVAIVAPATGRDPAQVLHQLAGPPPSTDEQLLDLAAGLRELERAAGVPPEEKGTT